VADPLFVTVLQPGLAHRLSPPGPAAKMTLMSSNLAVTDPASLGMDPGRLHNIDRFIAENYIESGRFPGFTLLVSRGGEIAHLSSQGNARDGVAMAEDTLVRIYSMSKPITSMALMSLYEEGRFKLDEPVSTFIPSWADLRVFSDGTAANYSTRFPEREMTVHDLLTHTSGLTYGFMGRHPVDSLYRRAGLDSGKHDLEAYVEILADIPLLFSPGTEWSYSVATDVIGRLVEIIGGSPLDQFLSQRFFEPLGMVDTGFWVDDDRADRLAANYAVPALSPFPMPEGSEGDSMMMIDAGDDTSPYRRKPTFLSGGGGLVSTVGDYHRFTQMLIRGGEYDGVRVLGPKTIEYAASNHLPGGQDLASMGQPVFSETRYDGVGFGLGFSVIVNPMAAQVISSPGEFAWGGAASTLFWIDPVEELTVIGLTQLMPSSAYPIRQELKALVYGAITE
jgi:CubicO group peptidase (beta-lactamase class C family)